MHAEAIAKKNDLSPPKKELYKNPKFRGATSRVMATLYPTKDYDPIQK